MNTLPQLAQMSPQWSLEEFVQVVNQFLPQFLPEAMTEHRTQEEVNPRLVRYYTTQGLLDKPLKHGREARYTYRHLVQVLLVRRLLGDGYTTSAIASLLPQKSTPDLEALLHGGVQLTVKPMNPALAFLHQVKQRPALPTAPAPPPSVSFNAPLPAPAGAMPSLNLCKRSMPDPAIAYPSPPAQSWIRVEIVPGLELHLREDFTYPDHPQAREHLLQLIAHHLTRLHS